MVTAITIRDGVGVDLPSGFRHLLEGCPQETLFILEWLRKIAMDFALPRLSADSKVIASIIVLYMDVCTICCIDLYL